MSESDAAAPQSGPRTLTIAGRELTIEPPSGRKAAQAFALLRAVSRDLPELIRKWGEFEQQYEASHVVEFDRAEAMRRFGGPQPLLSEGEVLRNEVTGEALTVPSALDEMSDEAWEAIGNVYRTRRSPDWWMTAAAVFSDASEAVEENVYRLLALFTIPNADVKELRKNGRLKDRLDELVDELLDDAGADELMELAVVAGEVVDGTFTAKARSLGEGGRLGNALRLVGLSPTNRQTPSEPTQTDRSSGTEEPSTPSTDTPSSSRPTSPTDSGEPSGGPLTPSSTSDTSSSELSATGSSSRPPE